MKKIFFLFFPFLFLVIACDKNDNTPIGDEAARLQAWIQVHNIKVQPTESGLYYINKQEGTGVQPVDSNYVLYSYTARTLDDFVFETQDKDTAKLYDLFSYTTHYAPSFRFYLAKIYKVKGLAEGLSYMREGGKARLIIPPTLGYGKNPPYSYVPSYSSLIFDVELIKVFSSPEEYESSMISNYFAANTGYTLRSDSVYVKRVKEGTRQCSVANDSIVQVNYVGKFLDGFVFDTNIKSVAVDNNIYSSSNSTKYSPLEFTVGKNAVVPGFETAIKYMIEGEKVIVVIPSKYAYGAADYTKGATPIPAYSTLVFELELVSVKKGKS